MSSRSELLSPPLGPAAPWASGGSDNGALTGQNQIFVSRLRDFPFREYSPAQGRWLSPDPAGLAAANPANPQTWNAYAYVGNQPLEYTDPTGLVDPAALYAQAQDEVLEATGGFEGGENEFQMMSIPVMAFAGDFQFGEYFVQPGPTVELPDGYGTTTIGQWVNIFLAPAYVPAGNGAELFGGPDPASLGAAGGDVPLSSRAQAILGLVGWQTAFLTHASFYAEWEGASLLGAVALEADGVWDAASGDGSS